MVSAMAMLVTVLLIGSIVKWIHSLQDVRMPISCHGLWDIDLIIKTGWAGFQTLRRTAVPWYGIGLAAASKAQHVEWPRSMSSQFLKLLYVKRISTMREISDDYRDGNLYMRLIGDCVDSYALLSYNPIIAIFEKRLSEIEPREIQSDSSESV